MKTVKRSLLVGCGNSRIKKVSLGGNADWIGDLTTMDMDPNCGADILFNLDRLSIPRAGALVIPGVLPFDDNTFDEIGCYDVLEHFGKQGDWRGYFTEMAEFHRVLKPGGTFGILVPIGADAMADPGHTRFFNVNHFFMLNQQWYADSIRDGMAVSDYRWYWTLNFDICYMSIEGDHHIAVVLVKA